MPLYGHPDHEPRGTPHGSPLVDATGHAVASGTGTDFGPFSIGAYQSVVLGLYNSGANDMTVEVVWDFEDSSGAYVGRKTATVVAGAKKRFIWQNEGDHLYVITFTGLGGATTADIYIAGSNLLPLAKGTPWAAAYTRAFPTDPNQSIPNNVATTLRFDHFKTSDSSVFSFDAVNSRIQTSLDGLYSAAGTVIWPPAGAAFYEYVLPRAAPVPDAGSIVGVYVPGEGDSAGAAMHFNEEGLNYFIVSDLSTPGPYFDSLVYQTSGIAQVLVDLRVLLIMRMGDLNE